MTWSVLDGDCRDLLATLQESSVDAVVTDPPYGLTSARPGGRSEATRGAVMGGFMGLAWDSTGVAFDPETWAAVRRVLKPGGHLVAFGGTRTYHRMVVAIEDAGFEIRDQLAWLFGQGFPKSRDLGDGWGTALKPAHEPIVLARRALSETNLGENMNRWGVGGLHIAVARLEPGEGGSRRGEASATRRYPDRGSTSFTQVPGPRGGDERGRWPANVAIDEEVAELVDEQAGPQRSGGTPPARPRDKTRTTYGRFDGIENPDGIGPSAGAVSRFFYCPKADREERDRGVTGDRPLPLWSTGTQTPNGFQNGPEARRSAPNHHPTVKPVALMQWLCRLITPGGGLVVDPFCGSGSTGVAALREGFRFVGMELDAEYAAIARERIQGDAPLFNTQEAPA